MRKSTYSFGADSPLKFEIPDKLAQHYNEAVTLYLKAHRRFTQKYGQKWDPFNDPIRIAWSREQNHAWNEIADLYNVLVNGNEHEAGPFHPIDFHDDFLVKNVVSAAAVATTKWGSSITTVALLGALYGVLRGRTGALWGPKGRRVDGSE